MMMLLSFKKLIEIVGKIQRAEPRKQDMNKKRSALLRSALNVSYWDCTGVISWSPFSWEFGQPRIAGPRNQGPSA